MGESRLINSTNNFVGKILYQLLILVVGFVSRKVFIQTLGLEYLGVSGLFSSILDMLSLAELGMGSVISVALYKPIADKNKEKIYAIMHFSKNVYLAVSASVFVVGVSLIPFLSYLIKGASNDVLQNLTLIYLLYLANSAISYLLIYKTALLITAQKEYKVVKYKSIIYFATAIIQITILLVFRDFVIYLIINAISTFCTNFIVSKKAENEFLFLKQKQKYRLTKEESSTIFINIRAYFLNRVSNVIMMNSNNIIVASFVSISLVGLRSNYYLITSQISNIFSTITSSLIPSLGNFAATETKEKQYLMFKNLLFFSFWFNCFSITGLFILISPLITLWLGEQYVLSYAIVIAMLFEVYLQGVLWPINVFRQVNGIFVQGRFRPLITAGINIILSIFFVKSYGLLGVFIAGIIARLITEFWYDARLVFRIVFVNELLSDYFIQWFAKLLILILSCSTSYFLFEVFPIVNYVSKFFYGLLICILVPNTILYFIYRTTDEFKFFKSLIYNFIRNFFSK